MANPNENKNEQLAADQMNGVNVDNNMNDLFEVS